MRPFITFLLTVFFILSVLLNCTLYGSITRVPYFGITMTEYAEKERDIFLLMYIAGGRLLPSNERIADISMALARRTYSKVFQNTVHHTEPIGPYATTKTFDLLALLIRFLYWIPPLTLALFFLVILIPRTRPLIEDE
jgi:hypothetical protein